MLRSDMSNVINKQKHRVIVECDVRVTSTCKVRFECSVRSLEKTRKSNDGKDVCNKCASKLKNSGNNNHAFKHHKNEDYFEKIDSEIKAYLLGWIASDGCIRPKTLHIELHEDDKEILELFRNEICPTALITKRKDRNTCWLTISSKKLISDLCYQLDVEPKIKQNKINLPKIDQGLLKHFLRGFFDGDGWVHAKRNTCGFSSICPILKEEIRQYFAKITNHDYVSDHDIQWNGHDAIQVMNHLYQNSSYRLSRKYKLYQEKLCKNL